MEDCERGGATGGQPRGDLAAIFAGIHGKVGIGAGLLADGVVERAVHSFLPEEMAVQDPESDDRQVSQVDDAEACTGCAQSKKG
jgi:hypothetical protein